MIQEKQRLLKDLSARLPYGVKVLDNSHKDYGASKVINIGIDGSILVDNETNDIQYYPIIDDIKPYLRSLSSMTEEEENQYITLNAYEDGIFPHTEEAFDYLNANYFDYRFLILEGIALEAPEDMYKQE